MRLSIAIREPAPDSHISSIDKTSPQTIWDEDHVRNMFPGSPQYLTERLGRAITTRRLRIIHRKERHEQSFEGVKNLEYDDGRTHTTTYQTESALYRPIEKVQASILEGDDDGHTDTTYAGSEDERFTRMPRLPAEAHDEQPYFCRICSSFVAAYTKPSWR